MLTIDECRAMLGDDAPETDEAVGELRDLVYLLAGSVLDSLVAKPNPEEASEC